jgi:hypothetical protein
MRRMCFSAVLAGLLFSFGSALHAQELGSCSLGNVKERVRPRFTGRATNGVVQIAASFAPDGSVAGSKVISGTQQLRFDAEAYVRGWKAEASGERQECVITVEYRLLPDTGCSMSSNIELKAEHVSDTHVVLTRDCDGF